MRTFEQRKEEIFRRSEKRIVQRRKNIWRAIVTCVPLVLCIGVVSGFALIHGPLKMDNSAPEAVMDHNQGMYSEDMVESPECMSEFAHEAVSLQVSDGNQSKLYTQQQILNKFQSMLVLPPKTTADESEILDMPESAEGYGEESNFSTQESSEYTLILTRSDGSQEVYDLTGDLLTGPYGDHNLTDAELAWIRSILETE